MTDLPDRLRAITHIDKATRVGELLDILNEAAAALDAALAEVELLHDQVRKFTAGGIELCRESEAEVERLLVVIRAARDDIDDNDESGAYLILKTALETTND